jgi:hypothetical protein
LNGRGKAFLHHAAADLPDAGRKSTRRACVPPRSSRISTMPSRVRKPRANSALIEPIFIIVRFTLAPP